MLLELAIGDAYGAGFEYAEPALVEQQNDLTKYIQHPYHAIKPGAYTDDTQMSLAIAEVIVAGEAWTPEVLADKFVTVFKRDPHLGYASRFYDFLQSVSDGSEFLAQINADSDKSGAAMRATPIGIFATVEEVIEKTKVQAALTHNTSDGINAAIAAALVAHYFLYNLGPKIELGCFIEEYVAGQWSAPWRGKVGAQGWMSVRAAITALRHSQTMSELLRTSIAFTGDVDTVATIALAAGAHSNEIKQDLPGHLYQGLERGPFGYDYIQELDNKLLACRS
jgi:ADP-ribosylglycohydrolase